ncbi:hypothetical protein [Streptomyces collinus]|uniref:hypothetical protein n=1 Tax=Streptomyces collinus TaxID=42684 RepID=UPI003319B1BC
MGYRLPARRPAGGPKDQTVAALAEHAATHASLADQYGHADPRGIAALLEAMRQAGQDQAVTKLAERAAADTGLTDSSEFAADRIAALLNAMRVVGAGRAAATLDRRSRDAGLQPDQFAVAAVLGVPPGVAARALGLECRQWGSSTRPLFFGVTLTPASLAGLRNATGSRTAELRQMQVDRYTGSYWTCRVWR